MAKKMGKSPLYWENREDWMRISALLHREEIVIAATDTVYGFLAPVSKASLKTLSALKGDREAKPFLVLIGSLGQLQKLIDTKTLTPELFALITQVWPGPVTFIFKAKKDLPSYLTSPQGTIALRWPRHDGLQAILIDFLGLFSTSANKAGEKPPTHANDIAKELLDKVTAFIDTKTKVSLDNKPSTILDCTMPGTIRVVREGLFSIQKLERIYGSSFRR